MITMEFDEMKKIWDSQNNEPLYVINEKALHGRILSKKKTGDRITNFTEILSIVVNGGGGISILTVNIFNKHPSLALYALAAWMILTALFVCLGRIRRLDGTLRFDRTMQGDLDHAISIAAYQVRISHLMRWNILPIGMLLLVGVWERGKSVWIAIGLLIFMVVINHLSRWEHNIYKRRKRELEILQGKLTS
jgi:hypothetical protein